MHPTRARDLEAGGEVIRPPIGAPDAPRPARPIRLVAIDVDGTTVDLRGRLHPRIRDAVRRVVAGGTPVVLATGRMYRSVLPWARELRTTTPLICYQGAMVRVLPGPDAPVVDGVPQGATLLEDPVAPAVALRALKIARAGGWHVQAYHDDRLLCEKGGVEAEVYSRIAQVAWHRVDDLAPIMAAGSTKVVCVVLDEPRARACEAALRAGLGDTARVVRSLPEFVEVTSPSASKGHALAGVCTQLGVDLGEVAAVGDAPNDIDMLSAAGYAVAVRTAQAGVLAVADAVCAPPEEAGLADVLAALGLLGPASRKGPVSDGGGRAHSISS